MYEFAQRSLFSSVSSARDDMVKNNMYIYIYIYNIIISYIYISLLSLLKLSYLLMIVHFHVFLR